ncbi:hypothetical protein COP2_024346 [Malus domestica]
MIVISPSWKEEESQSYEMQRESSFKPVRCLLAMMLCAILLVSPVTVFIFGFHISYPQSFFSFNASISHDQFVMPYSLHTDVSHLQIQLGLLLQQLHNESSESKVLLEFSDQVLRIAISLDKLADSIEKKHQPDKDEVSTVDEDFTNPEEGEGEAEEQVPGGTIFTSGEIRIYISPKQNRQIS